MRHPLGSPRFQRIGVFVLLLVATIVLTVVLAIVGPGQPTIVNLEFAANSVTAAQIVAGWSRADQLSAAFNLGLDYLYMIVYSTTLAVAACWAALRARGHAWSSAGFLLAWGAWLAACFDAVENGALLSVLMSPTTATAEPGVAAVCASIKFALVILVIVYLVASVIAELVGRSRPRSPSGASAPIGRTGLDRPGETEGDPSI